MSESKKVDGKEISGARYMRAVAAGHGGSSLSVMLTVSPYRWIRKALSTLRHLNQPLHRHIDVAGT